MRKLTGFVLVGFLLLGLRWSGIDSLILRADDDKPQGPNNAGELPLFDFEEEADAKKHWENLRLAKQAAFAPAHGDPEHPVQIESSTDHAATGKRCLKLTFRGGQFPTVRTTRLPVEDLTSYKAFQATVTAGRTCVVVFRLMDDMSSRDRPGSRWEKVALLHAGRNEVCDVFGVKSKAVAFEIALYSPKEGESIYVDSIRLSKEPPKHATPFRQKNPVYANQPVPLYPRLDSGLKVLGWRQEVGTALELGEHLKDKWVKPEGEKTVDEVEAEFKKLHAGLKAKHPKAILAVLRDGEKGYDPTDLAKVYDGWKDAYMNGHEPGAVFLTQAYNRGSEPRMEIYLRHRCPVMQVDLSSMPRGSNTLAAWLVLTREGEPRPNTPEATVHQRATSVYKPTVFVAEPCNRPWVESEVNCLEYAKGKFWNETCGRDWNGRDPDFRPVIIAHGQSQVRVSTWDFTRAVKYWTEEGRENHGFVLYSLYPGYADYFLAHTRECPDVKKRPALMVSYLPAP